MLRLLTLFPAAWLAVRTYDTVEDAYVMQFRFAEEAAEPIQMSNRITRLAG